ncbi:hypothetical protein [Mesorhizobium sp.]|uniref:hypothetical protein n=1 Tax=Mesorhizobium sp. TaxID=1871066 RepID=UPI0025FF4F25|nr:hypothetical protein [Mesorhizobium sp.]
MPVVQREIRKRGFFGHVFKWLFIIFNILMLLWLVGYWSQISGMIGHGSDAEKAGGAIGAAIGTSMLLFFWVAGDIILGLFTLLTRGKRILITEDAR